MSSMIRYRRFGSSFRSRLFLILTIFTGIISAAFVLVLISGEIRNYQERSNEKAQLLASLLAGNITLPLYSENNLELNRVANDLFCTPHVARVVIADADNRVLVDITSPKITSVTPLISSTAQVLATTSSPTAEAALSGIPSHSATRLGSVTVSIDAADKRATIRSALVQAGSLALLFWVAVIAACYPVLKRITQSFNALTVGLDGMMLGALSTKIVVERDDEAGRAAQAVNRLADALVARENENRILQEELVKAMELEVQEERKKIMAKLIQTNRLTSLGLMISSIAHNINTPNGAIKLAAQHLAGAWKNALPILEGVSKEEGDFILGGLPFGDAKIEIRGATESILNNAARVERVIHDLRAYNVGERNELRPGVMVNRAVEEALTIIRAHGRQGEISIIHNLASDLPHIIGNQYQLEQVVVNLLLNAIQSMPEGKGTVVVQTVFVAEQAEVLILISDQGEGIPAEMKKHLFEAFFSTKLDRGGSGLGLYISNFIVTEHKGRLTVESSEKGTVATVSLPVADGSQL